MELRVWLDDIRHRGQMLRPSTAAYQRYDAAARRLTVAAIFASRDIETLELLAQLLRRARQPAELLGRLERVWSRAELGELIVAATNRVTLLRLGRLEPKSKGPTLDPRFLPDDRLDWLIQRHRDLALVDALRAERARRQFTYGAAA